MILSISNDSAYIVCMYMNNVQWKQSTAIKIIFFAKGAVEERYKVTSGRVQTCSAARNQGQVCVLLCYFPCRNSICEISVSGYLAQLRVHKSDVCGFKPHMRLTLNLQTKSLSPRLNAEYVITSATKNIW